MVAEADDSLMERFFEAGTLTQDELVAGLRKAVLTGRWPRSSARRARRTSASRRCSTRSSSYLPSPAERPFPALDGAGAETTREPAASGPYAAFVWKTVADPFAGRITLFRVVTGTLKADSTVHNLTRDTTERLGALMVMQGKTADARCRSSRPATSARWPS